MKTIIKAKLMVFIFIIISITGLSQSIDNENARLIAGEFLKISYPGYRGSVLQVTPVLSSNKHSVLFYICHFDNKGFVVVAGSKSLPPVLAFSLSNAFGEISEKNPLLKLLTADNEKRLQDVRNFNENAFRNEWSYLLSNRVKGKNIPVQYWPAMENTTTGGWISENWSQGSPFNNKCPIDPVTGNRSLAGCPAIAMAMIMNFHHTINGVLFTDADDYFHNYQGRQYWIDNDYATHGFPSFPQLNAFLQNLQNSYTNHLALTADDKAAICFACGVAAHQVYTSSGSGTFGVNQAYEAYTKFNCTGHTLITADSTGLYKLISENIQVGLPVHLAVVDQGWTMGHNLVIDGYNSDHFFHLNFGWGGSYNSWYIIPSGIPYGLTVLEGVVLNILKPQNTPPIVFNYKKSGYEDSVISFNSNDFTDNYKDIQGDAMTAIKILSIPLLGNLYYNDNEVLINKIIPADSVHLLKFVPHPDISGITAFKYSATDGLSWACCHAMCVIELAAVNDPPVFVLSGNINVQQDFTGIETIYIFPAAVPADETNQVVQYRLEPPSLSFVRMELFVGLKLIRFTSLQGKYGSDTVKVIATEPASQQNQIWEQTFTVTVNSGADITAMSNSNQFFYCNAFNKCLVLSDAYQVKSISIFDINGKMLLNKEKPICQVNIERLHRGIYLVKLELANQIVFQKFVW